MSESIHQIALLQSLLRGSYRGSVPLSDVRTHGDTGIGTFDSLDGEMILLDGVFYRADGNGKVSVVDETVTTPFCDVTLFDPEREETITDVTSFPDLTAQLTKLCRPCLNRPHFVLIKGLFSSVTVRSVRKQSEPFLPLDQVMKNDQTVFSASDVSATAVGLYCPAYMNGINMPGWHLHLISDDRTFGGHLLSVAFERASVFIETKNGFSVSLPNDSSFDELDLAADQSDIAAKVESGKLD